MYVFLHRLNLPATWPMICLYAAGVAALCELVHFLSSSDLTDPHDLAETVHLEVLLPAFTVGCIIKHEEEKPTLQPNASLSDLPVPKRSLADMIPAETVKASISAVFMVLVGFSMPPLFSDAHETEAHRRLEASSSSTSDPMEPGQIVLHVVMCTILMNLGKLFPACCYRKEANLRTRIALAVAMMPRGEVCAGIIVNALALGIKGPAMTIAVFCLAGNMMSISVFIFIVKKLTNADAANSVPDAKAREVSPSASSPAEPPNNAEPGSGAQTRPVIEGDEVSTAL